VRRIADVAVLDLPVRELDLAVLNLDRAVVDRGHDLALPADAGDPHRACVPTGPAVRRVRLEIEAAQIALGVPGRAIPSDDPVVGAAAPCARGADSPHDPERDCDARIFARGSGERPEAGKAP
jgi:hypothetical protein